MRTELWTRFAKHGPLVFELCVAIAHFRPTSAGVFEASLRFY